MPRYMDEKFIEVGDRGTLTIIPGQEEGLRPGAYERLARGESLRYDDVFEPSEYSDDEDPAATVRMSSPEEVAAYHSTPPRRFGSGPGAP